MDSLILFLKVDTNFTEAVSSIASYVAMAL